MAKSSSVATADGGNEGPGSARRPRSSTPARAWSGPGQELRRPPPRARGGTRPRCTRRGAASWRSPRWTGPCRDRRRRRRRRGSCRRRRSRTAPWRARAPMAMRECPPRGTRQSIMPSSCMNSHRRLPARVGHVAPRRPRAGPTFASASRRQATMAALERGRGGRAPQHGGVARLQAQPGRVTGDVGPVLVDDPDHAERDPDALDPQAVGADPALDHLAHRVGQGRPPGAGRRPWPPIRASVRRSRSSSVAPAPSARARSRSVGVGCQQLGAALFEQVSGHGAGRRP